MASIRTVAPSVKSLPSRVETTIRSFDSSLWYEPEVPSAQESPKVLGWLGSGPRPARPSTSDRESQELPATSQAGAW